MSNGIANDILMHYGVLRRSGRYPYGSGDNPYQRSGDFLSRVRDYELAGLSQTEIAREMKLTTTQFRAEKALALAERRGLDVDRAKSLAQDGLTPTEIGRLMGKNESTIRSYLNEDAEARMREAMKTADFIREQIDTRGMIDVGTGVELELGASGLGISKEKLDQALYILEKEGYVVYGGGLPQATNPGQQTNLRVICPPGTEHKEIYNFENVHSLVDYYSHDGGDTFDKLQPPSSLDGNRVMIRYNEEGGLAKDGIIEIRRGIDDISLGESRYAQVRILVDGDKYMKGMAVYSDDLPDGVDIVYNSHELLGTPTNKVFKPAATDDPNNPFGSYIKPNGQSFYIDENGERQLSPINKLREEGEWGSWAKNTPSQFLAKQNLQLINKQLDLAIADKESMFETINSLTNPVVRKEMLKDFADGCDSSALHLEAAALPRQSYQVILPVNSLKDNEVYAPNYKNGEKVALIRYPHGGPFEIPILTVNNKHQDAIDMLGKTPVDAIAVNKRVADRLSGADFDGDTVMVIPTGGKINITSRPPLKALEGFDPRMAYPEKEGMKYMKGVKENGKIYDNTQNEMGRISNLITDMTIKGAPEDKIAKAVKHSMVVIDAAKHKLNYKQSEKDNDIASLKKEFQLKEDGKFGGASTILSRAKSETSIPKKQGSPTIDPLTGVYKWKENETTYTDPKTGKQKVRTQVSTKMAETTDARTLSSGTVKEEAYASYANKLKALANEARKGILAAGKVIYSPSANKTYAKEVDSLKAKLNVALKNAPRERKANLVANAKSYEGLTKAEIKKAKQVNLKIAREEVGAKKKPITFTDKEWDAVQAGAVSESMLTKIIKEVNKNELWNRSLPKQSNTLSTAQINKIKSMGNSGYSTSEIAEAMGISTNAVYTYL